MKGPRAPKHVEVKIGRERNGYRTLWISTEKGCVLRIGSIKHLVLSVEEMEEKK